MNYLESWNKVIKYIEDNLDQDINLDYISKMVGCTPLHFIKMFSYLTNMSLNEYIRKRKMTKVVEEIQNTNTKIIDLAIKYGYDSPTAFNRVFKSIIGITPREVRKKGTTVRIYPPISFNFVIKGESEMKYRIEEKESFKVIGVKKHYKGPDDSFKNVPLFWNGIGKTNTIPELCKLMNNEPFGILGVCSNSANTEFDYYIGVASSKDTPNNFNELIVPKCTWAIFECVGAMPNAIQDMQKRIMTEWLPNSIYKFAEAPDLEVYNEGDNTLPTYKSEVWIPIVKK